MNYVVYAIGLEQNLVEPYSKCYVGVTKDLQNRFKSHSNSKYTVGKYIRENNLIYENNFCVLFTGSEEECFDMEIKYRPFPLMGLNEATGGRGGYTKYTEERSAKIAAKFKGRKITWGDKISSTKKELKQSVGAKNGMAKQWKIIDPIGVEYEFNGTFSNFCDEHILLGRTLKYYLNKNVPSPAVNGYGGFRGKDSKQIERRYNTTGWKLQIL